MPKRDWWKSEFRWLVTLGESTTAGGWSSSRARSWASELARLINEFQRVPVQLINVGIGANVISTRSPNYPISGKPAADERLERDVLSARVNGRLIKPDLVVVSYGLNDARGGTPMPLFSRELRALVQRIKHRLKALVVLIGPYYAYRLKLRRWNHADLRTLVQYNDLVRQTAKATDCLFADVFSAFEQARWLVHHDGVHANDLGHRVIANEIFRVLAANCSCLARETRTLEHRIPPWRDESMLRNGS